MRLNKDTKASIARNTVNKVMQATGDALALEEDALARMVYDAAYPPEIQHQMGRLPDEFFIQQSDVYVNLTGGNDIRLALASSRKISALDHHRYHAPMIDLSAAENSFKARIMRYCEERKTAQARASELHNQMKVFLDGFSTTERLVKEWPEGRAYYQKYMDAPLPNPLAVSAAAINGMIEELSDAVKVADAPVKKARKARAKA